MAQTMPDTVTFLDKLNYQQKNACTCTKNVLLTACPGSGKTRTLTYRLAFFQNSYPESNLLNVAITYTNKAAEEISERLEVLVGNVDNAWVGTIHQFCLNFVLYPYAQFSKRLDTGFRVIDQWEQEKIRDEYKDEYEDHLIKSKLIDFDGILNETLDLLQKNKFIAKNLADIIRSLSVDEYQDTQEIQYEILATIYRCKSTIKLFFVGDPNQAIFIGLGGLAKTIDQLNQQFNTEFIDLKLSGCYRSSQKIIDYYRNFEVTPVEIKSQLEIEPGLIYYNNIISFNKLSELISKIIKTEIKRGVPLNEICITAPQWRLLFDMVDLLKIKLPEVMFNSPQITPFKYEPDNAFYFLAKILFTQRGRLTNHRLKWASKLLSLLKKNYGIAEADEIMPIDVLNMINHTPYFQIATEYFIHAKTKLLSSFSENPSGPIEKNFEDYLDEVKKRLSRHHFNDSTDEFFNFFKPKEGVIVDTIHGIKGREFKVVIAFSLHEKKIPHYRSIKNNPASARKEAKRLLYVLCSRTESHLYLFSEKDSMGHSPTQELNNIVIAYDKLPFVSSDTLN